MGYRPGSRRSGEKFQRSLHEKTKSKTRRSKKSKLLPEERSLSSPEEIAGKTINGLRRLGEQKFAVSPFSHYFDDWLINFREVISEFENTPDVAIDEVFLKEREQVVSKIHQELVEIKRDEAVLNSKLNDLSKENHLLVELDAQYAAQTREIGSQKNPEIQQLTLNLRNLEDELENIRATKTSFFGPVTKKTKVRKQTEIQQKIDSVKKEVEGAIQNFKIEQERFHDEYEKKKQTVIAQVLHLEKEVEKLETDSSLAPRHNASEELINAVKAFLMRQASSAN